MKKMIFSAVLIMAMFALSFGVDRAGRTDSATRGDFIHSVYEAIFGDATSTPYTYIDSQSVRDMVNDVALAVSKDYLDAVVRMDTVITSAYVCVYSINTDCIRIIDIARKDTLTKTLTSLTEILENQKGYRISSTAQPPKNWTMYSKTQIYVEPVNVGTDTLIIKYQARANKMTSDTTTTNVNMDYYDIVVQETVKRLTAPRVDSPMYDRVNASATKSEEISRALRIANMPKSIKIEDVKGQ